MLLTLLWQRICVIDTNDIRYTFSFFLFFLVLIADEALGIHRWKNKLLALKWWKSTAAILAYCHPPLPLHPTNKPSNGRIHPQPLTTTVWLKYWFSVLKTLSEPKIFNSHLNEASTKGNSFPHQEEMDHYTFLGNCPPTPPLSQH